MASCDAAHAELDKWVGAQTQVGELPGWTRVRGKVAWKVVQGPYSGLDAAWREFTIGLGSVQARPNGPCGDVYACQIPDHEPDGGAKLLTILYAPVA